MAVIGEIWGVLAVDGRLLRVLGRLGLRRSRRARLRHRAAVGVHVVEQVVVGARRRVLDPRLRDRVRVRVRGWVGIRAGRGCILRAFYTAFWAISPPNLPHISLVSPLHLALYAAFSAAILACSASRLLRAFSANSARAAPAASSPT